MQDIHRLERLDHLPAGDTFGQRNPIPRVGLGLLFVVDRRNLISAGHEFGAFDKAVGRRIPLANLCQHAGHAHAIDDFGATAAGATTGDLIGDLCHRHPRLQQVAAGLQLAGLVRITRANAKHRIRADRALLCQIAADPRHVGARRHPQTDRALQRTFGGILRLAPEDDAAQKEQHHHQDCQHVRGEAAPHHLGFPKITDALVPPKPKELDSATLISRSRLALGARSTAVSTAGLSRLMVGGAT